MYQEDIDKFTALVDLLQQLVDQNEYNKKMCASLTTLASQVKNQAIEAANSAPLHRFNVDLSKEVFESELEKTNAQAVIENHTLHHENRQLTSLLKEYEQTLATIMSKFQNHTLAAREHEFRLTRHYEKLLYTREPSTLHPDFSSNPNIVLSLSRLCRLLRCLTHSIAGEQLNESSNSEAHVHFISSTATSYPPRSYPEYDAGIPLHPDPDPSEALVSPSIADEVIELLEDLLADREDWAIERETEIARLENENEALRKALGIDGGTADKNGWLEDEARDLLITSRYIPLHGQYGHSSPAPGTHGLGSTLGANRMERSGSPVLGVGMFTGMRVPPPPSPFMAVPSSGPQTNGFLGGDITNGGSLGGGGIHSQISVHLSQGAGSALSAAVAAQARESSLPGVRGGGAQGRRPAMFGRGRGGGLTSSLARDGMHFGVLEGPGSIGTGGLDRPWQAQAGLDLS